MDPLQELTVLLAVEVKDGRRERVIVDGRPQPQDNAWRLALHGACYALEDPELVGDSRPWSHCVKSRDFRSRTAPHPMPHPRGQPVPQSAPARRQWHFANRVLTVCIGQTPGHQSAHL